MQSLADKHGVPMVTNHLCGMFGAFFTKASTVESFSDVEKCNIKQFNAFFHEMLKRGVYLAPSAFEAGFLSIAHSVEDLDATLAAADEALAVVA